MFKFGFVVLLPLLYALRPSPIYRESPLYPKGIPEKEAPVYRELRVSAAALQVSFKALARLYTLCEFFTDYLNAKKSSDCPRGTITALWNNARV